MKKYLPLNEKELAHKICSFRLIVAYTLKSVLLCISVGWTSFLLFELHVAVSHIKVKFMHNLLKLVPIYHLKSAKNLLSVFIYFKRKKSVRQIRPTELLE